MVDELRDAILDGAVVIFSGHGIAVGLLFFRIDCWELADAVVLSTGLGQSVL